MTFNQTDRQTNKQTSKHEQINISIELNTLGQSANVKCQTKICCKQIFIYCFTDKLIIKFKYKETIPDVINASKVNFYENCD